MTSRMRTLTEPPPGAAAVADLRTLPDARVLAVLFLRDWCDEDRGRAEVESVLYSALGVGALPAMRALAGLVDMLAVAGRRPLALHHPACRCVGADEAWWAELIVRAPQDTAEASMLAALMVPPSRAPQIAGMAVTLGRAVARVSARRARAAASPAQKIRTLH